MSILRFLANHVTAADLQTRFGPTLSIDEDARSAEERGVADIPDSKTWSRLGRDPTLETFFLVRNTDGRITHVIDSIGLAEADITVADAAVEISSADCVAADTPALQLVRFFEKRQRAWAFVLTGTELSGVVAVEDLSKPEFTACLFASLLDLEQRCAETIANDDAVDSLFARLSSNRQAKALEVFQRRHRIPAIPHRGSIQQQTVVESPGLVFCTTFADKAKMLLALPQFSDMPKRMLVGGFASLEKLRNELAHTGTNIVVGLDRLVSAISFSDDVARRLAPPSEATIRLVKSDRSPGFGAQRQ